jgi:hypothetical protein
MIFLPRNILQYLATFLDMTPWEEGAIGIQWPEANNAALYPTDTQGSKKELLKLSLWNPELANVTKENDKFKLRILASSHGTNETQGP